MSITLSGGIAWRVADAFSLSPAASGERAEAGQICGGFKFSRVFRPRVRGGDLLGPHFAYVRFSDAAPLEQAAAPHPNPLPLRAKCARGRGDDSEHLSRRRFGRHP